MKFMHFIPGRNVQHILSAPVIYSGIIIFIILDVWVEIYHRICFPLYGLPYVRRASYIRVDRYRLHYLSWYAKINCAYCGYANGLIEYVRAIAGETEKYWCAIKHKKDPGALFFPPSYQKDFLPYGDVKAYRDFIKKKEKKI